MKKVTHIKRVRLTRRTHRAGEAMTRTMQGKRVMKLLGDCIRAGGKTGFRHWQDEDGSEWAEVTLEWPEEQQTGA